MTSHEIIECVRNAVARGWAHFPTPSHAAQTPSTNGRRPKTNARIVIKDWADEKDYHHKYHRALMALYKSNGLTARGTPYKRPPRPPMTAEQIHERALGYQRKRRARLVANGLTSNGAVRVRPYSQRKQKKIR